MGQLRCARNAKSRMKKTTSSPPSRHGLAPLALYVALAAPGFPLAAMANGTSPAGRSLSLHFPTSFFPLRTEIHCLPSPLPQLRPPIRAGRQVLGESSHKCGKCRWRMRATRPPIPSPNAPLPPADAPSKAQTVLHFTVTRQDTHETLIGAAVRCQGVLAVTDHNGQCTIRLKNNPGRVHVEVTYIGCHKLVRTLPVPARRPHRPRLERRQSGDAKRRGHHPAQTHLRVAAIGRRENGRH